MLAPRPLRASQVKSDSDEEARPGRPAEEPAGRNNTCARTKDSEGPFSLETRPPPKPLDSFAGTKRGPLGASQSQSQSPAADAAGTVPGTRPPPFLSGKGSMRFLSDSENSDAAAAAGRESPCPRVARAPRQGAPTARPGPRPARALCPRAGLASDCRGDIQHSEAVRGRLGPHPSHWRGARPPFGGHGDRLRRRGPAPPPQTRATRPGGPGAHLGVSNQRV